MDKKELLRNFRTEGILGAAMKVIAERGLEKATMEQVAEEAGISKATIYLYFKGKDDLYLHLVISRFDEMLSAMKEAASGINDPVARVEAVIRAQVMAMERYKDFIRVFLTERPVVPPGEGSGLGRELAKRHREYSGLVIKALQDGIGSGVLKRVDPVKGFYLLLAMVRGMAFYKLVRKDEPGLASEADLILDVFWNGLKRR